MKRVRSRLGLLLVLGMLTAILPVGAVAPAAAAAPGDLVINEIIQNPAAVSDANGEWFELFNSTGADIDIDGWTISDDDSDSHLISNGGPLVVPAGGYLVLGSNTDSAENGGVTVAYDYGSIALANGADELVLSDDLAIEIDRVEYDGGTQWPDPTGASMSLVDSTADNNVGSNWCTSTTPFGAGDLGTPGAANTCETPLSGTGLAIPGTVPAGGTTTLTVTVTPATDPPSTLISVSADLSPIGGNSDQDFADDGTGLSFSFDAMVGTGIADGDYPLTVSIADNEGATASTTIVVSVLTVLPDSSLVISGVIDGPLSGGVPKAVEFYAMDDIADLSTYGFGSANNGGGSDGEEFSFTGSATAGDYIYVASETIGFSAFFGFAPDHTSNAASINGDDAIELFLDDVVVDVFGDINMDGTNEPWEHLDGWAYRVDQTGPDGSTFELDSWTFSGPNALDGETTNAEADVPFPIGTYIGEAVLSGIGFATPSAVFPGDAVLLTVTVTPGEDPPSTGITVVGDLTDIGGSATQAFTDDGGNSFSFATTVAAATAGGLYHLPITITDTEGTATTSISIDVIRRAAIYEIQGNGAASPLEGNVVLVEALVTADHQDGDLNGFFLQDVVGDGDVTTSDGVFVWEGGNSTDVNVGDIVELIGEVEERYGHTQLTNIADLSVISSGNTVVATPIDLPWDSLDEPEQYEGMLVTVPQSLYITESYNFARYGEILLASERLLQPTAVEDPGSAGFVAKTESNALATITLDDNRTSENPDPAIHPDGTVFDINNTFRGGDTVQNVTGVMNYDFGLYRIQPTRGADYSPANPRTAAPAAVGGSLTVASFNVLNYFTTLGSRGADDADEFERQRAKIISAISAIDADVVGLMEIENNDAAIIDLVDGLNAANGAGTYAYVDTGLIGTDQIKVAFIYKPATVKLDGAFRILDSTVDPLFNDDKNRPALAQTFMEKATGESVTVAVNHLKSKGSDCDELGDPDTGDGSGNCNLTRTEAAQALARWLADSDDSDDSDDRFDEDVLIIGDLNAYDKEDPIDALLDAGYSDLIDDLPGDEAYSYVFDGRWGYLDYAMANQALRPAVTGTTVWHINADESRLIDYDTEYNDPLYYAPDAYRASDHDPVIVGLDLAAPEVTAEFDKIYAGYFTGLYTVDYSCDDLVDPNPTCVGDINGITVEDGQRVFLIKSSWGQPWSRMIGSTLYIKAPSFTLTVTGTDASGNTATVTDDPEFRPWHRHRKAI